MVRQDKSGSKIAPTVLFAIRIVQNKLCSGFSVRTHILRKVQQVKLSKTLTDSNVPDARGESVELCLWVEAGELHRTIDLERHPA